MTSRTTERFRKALHGLPRSIRNRYRSLGVRTDDAMIWFWIGSHSEYDQILKRL
jgi:hypothetical protein